MNRSSIRLALALAGCMAPWAAEAGRVVQGASGGFEFRESFRWAGNHAATIKNGVATTVWWDPDSWDVRGDTTYLATSAPLAGGFHTDIHKAASPDPRDGVQQNDAWIPGGEGSPGIGVMHVDYQGIVSARLRNPLLVSNSEPAMVSFYAPRFQTTGHWWEVAFTPASIVVGAEHTSLPSVTDPLEDPLQPGGPGTPGPGHRPAADSVNVIATGFPDVPCSQGWYVRFGVRKTIGGTASDYVRTVSRISDLVHTDPSEIDELYLWRIELQPGRIDLYGDMDEDGIAEPLESWTVDTPWPAVHVHFIAVAYQADHHPQEPCFLGKVREFAWRDVTVRPVAYSATIATPKERLTDNIPRVTGWMQYDLRDTQRYGPAVNGAPQANEAKYDPFASLAWCSSPQFYCSNPVPDVTLQFVLERSSNLARAELLYDIKSLRGPGTAVLSVNGTVVGPLPSHDTVPAAATEEWTRRSIDIAPDVLQVGVNTIRIDLTGDVQLDRLQIELSYSGEVRRRGVRR